MPVQRRPITPEEYHRLAAIGVLEAGGVELHEGWIVYGRFPFVFSEAAVVAARVAGIELDEPDQPAASGDATTVVARRLWQELEPIMLILVEQGGVQFETAFSWLAEPD